MARRLVLSMILMLGLLIPVTAVAQGVVDAEAVQAEHLISQDAGTAFPSWLLLTALLLIASAGTIDVLGGEIARQRMARARRFESVMLWPRRSEDRSH